MKYVVILGDGMADRPFADFQGRTALQMANKPTVDHLASKGIVGMAKTVPDHMPPGSDTANLSVLGYDPERFYSGRSPFEGYSIGVKMADTDVSFRCNFVTLEGSGPYEDMTIVDHSSDEITTAEAAELLDAVIQAFATEEIHFFTGVSYRHLMLWNHGPYSWKLIPPHDILGRRIGDYLPKETAFAEDGSMPNARIVEEMMRKSHALLKDHPVNQTRVARGLRPANSIWIWGEGKKPQLTSFPEKYKKTGSVISAVDLIKGIGLCAGLESIDVEGATGNLHTNFEGKATAAINALKSGQDFVYLHIEAPDECSHRFEPENKIRAIELIDEKIVSPVKRALDELGEEYRIMILPDHPTPLEIRTHSHEAVPFLIYQSSAETDSGVASYDEAACSSTGLLFPKGFLLMDYFMQNEIRVNSYRSTRGGGREYSASEAVLKGIADDGGLFVPTNLPTLRMPLSALLSMDYKSLAYEVMRLYLSDYTEAELKAAIDSAYDEKFDVPEIAPLVIRNDVAFLELYHGRTLAFKDMALSILPYLLTTASKKLGADDEIVILTATSGDTGKAAMEGFADVPGTRIVVFFPENGVSEIQKKQMTTQTGTNTHVVGIHGNFDDAQTAVKKMFTDEALNQRLKAQGKVFSSANSINIGRLIPQVVYYFHAYKQAVEKGYIKLGETLDFVVPTGNFGNILAGYYAMKLGLPVDKLVCASNENKVLFDFLATGTYDRNRDFLLTSSPSMDILISSNLERLLYHLAEEIPTVSASEVVRELMQDLKTKGAYTISDEMKGNLCTFLGGYCSEKETAEAISSLFQSSGYVVDTHTAVGYGTYQELVKKATIKGKSVILSTASPYKFPEAVAQALGLNTADASLKDVVTRLGEASQTEIPYQVRSLETAPILHKTVCEIDEMQKIVEDILGLTP